MPVLINVRRLEEKEIRVKGKLPAAELQLEAPDELVQARQPLYYDLTAQQAGPNVIVRGQLQMALDCACARCLKPFKCNLELPDWTVAVPLEGPEKAVLKDDALDLTPYLREDILLEFPQHPLCEADCAGLPNRADVTKKKEGTGPAQNASAWAELNKLKF